MHHVRKIRDLKNKKLDLITMEMAAINRKQVPVCKPHHIAIHKNELTAEERELFKSGLRDLISNKKAVTE